MPLGDSDADAETVRVPLREPVSLLDLEPLGDPERLSLGDGDHVALRELLGETDGDAECEGVSDDDTERVAVTCR